MKNRVKNIAAGIGYLALFFGVNLLVSFVVEFIYGFKAGVEMALTGGAMAEQAFMEGLLAFVNEYSAIITMAYQIIAIGIIWVILKLRKKHFCEEVTLKPFDKKAILPIIVMGIAVQFFVSYAMELLPIPEDIMNAYVQASSPLLQSQNLLIQIVALAVVAPIAEEIVFRGLILSRFKKAMPTVVAIVLSSVLFGLIHLQLLWIIYAALMGMLLAVVAEQEKSIGASILLHMAINFSALFVELIPVKGIVMGVVCVVALAIIAVTLYTIVKKQSLKTV